MVVHCKKPDWEILKDSKRYNRRYKTIELLVFAEIEAAEEFVRLAERESRKKRTK
jgi:hypothetical protein